MAQPLRQSWTTDLEPASCRVRPEAEQVPQSIRKAGGGPSLGAARHGIGDRAMLALVSIVAAEELRQPINAKARSGVEESIEDAQRRPLCRDRSGESRPG